MKLIDIDYHDDCSATFIYEAANEEVKEHDHDFYNECCGHFWERATTWDGNPEWLESYPVEPETYWKEERESMTKDYWETVKEILT